MYLLDTNVVSELRRPEKTNPRVAQWASGVSPVGVFLSAISVLEIERGILRVVRRDGPQGAMLRVWFEERILPAFEGRILAVDVTVARRCARLHIPNPMAERDALIAATALVHGMTVVTRNVADFEGTGVVLLNPWDA
jgi:toxin FitB